MNRVLKVQEKNLRIYQIIKSAVPHKASKINEDSFAVINIYKFVLHLYLKRTRRAQLHVKEIMDPRSNKYTHNDMDKYGTKEITKK